MVIDVYRGAGAAEPVHSLHSLQGAPPSVKMMKWTQNIESLRNQQAPGLL